MAKALETATRGREKWEWFFLARAGRKVVECGMFRVLVATDFSEDGRCVVDYAANLARQTGGKMYLLHAVEPCMMDAAACVPLEGEEPPPTAEYRPGETRCISLLELANKRAQAAAEKISARWDIPIYGKAEEADDIVECVHGFCERHDIDMLVIGNRHHSLLTSILLGNTAEKLMRSAKIPVTVVPCPPRS